MSRSPEMSQPYRDQPMHATGSRGGLDEHDGSRYSNPELDNYFDGSIPVRTISLGRC